MEIIKTLDLLRHFLAGALNWAVPDLKLNISLFDVPKLQYFRHILYNAVYNPIQR